MRIRDQLGFNIEFDRPPVRIISLVPSITELLAELGLDDRVCGVTKFCIHPDNWYRNKQRVGGTKQINSEIIRKLNPDLIIANKEENVKDQIEQLKEICAVYISDVNTFDDALEMIRAIGLITNSRKSAEIITQKIQSGIDLLEHDKINTPKHHSVAYLIWQDPLMVAGAGTFIDHMLTLAGYSNVFGHKDRYPEITFHDLRSAKVDLLFLSSEPFPFNENHIGPFRDQVPNSKIIPVDGTYFSWYGSRLMKAVDYFRSLRQNIPN